MCFTIDPNATCPKRRKVYKVLRIHRGVLMSPFHRKTRWVEDQVVEIDGVLPTHFSPWFSPKERKTEAGIYVLMSEKDALDAINALPRGSREKYVIAVLSVRPEDWLYSRKDSARDSASILPNVSFNLGRFVPMATYRKAKLASWQPYFYWVK